MQDGCPETWNNGKGLTIHVKILRVGRGLASLLNDACSYHSSDFDEQRFQLRRRNSLHPAKLEQIRMEKSSHVLLLVFFPFCSYWSGRLWGEQTKLGGGGRERKQPTNEMHSKNFRPQKSSWSLDAVWGAKAALTKTFLPHRFYVLF